ncbi:VOC family protein [Seohaeicola saemankumensis]|nr:VOC family protein [Seohaeicola saemankumensis]MCA0870950.1 VOC family protein [Seohaeicola saemankumensis]
MTASLEHTNLTVSDPDATAAWMCDLFGWHIRWAGAAISGGRTVHVGTDDRYLALYTPKSAAQPGTSSYDIIGGLNHVGLVVDDIDLAETRVKAAGFEPINHADYEPGRRFYFLDHDGIEFELVAYD